MTRKCLINADLKH